MKKLLFVAALSLALTACKLTTPNLPKGALNTFDFDSYQSLMVAQATLNSLKSQAPALEAQTPGFKAILNDAIADYNAAEKAWQAYHQGGGNTAAVTTALTQLSTDLLKVTGTIPGSVTK